MGRLSVFSRAGKGLSSLTYLQEGRTQNRLSRSVQALGREPDPDLASAGYIGAQRAKWAPSPAPAPSLLVSALQG